MIWDHVQIARLIRLISSLVHFASFVYASLVWQSDLITLATGFVLTSYIFIQMLFYPNDIIFPTRKDHALFVSNYFLRWIVLHLLHPTCFFVYFLMYIRLNDVWIILCVVVNEFILLFSCHTYHNVFKSCNWGIFRMLTQIQMFDKFGCHSIMMYTPSFKWTLFNTLSFERFENFVTFSKDNDAFSIPCTFKPLNKWYYYSIPICITDIYQCEIVKNLFLIKTGFEKSCLVFVDPVSFQTRDIHLTINLKHESLYCIIQMQWMLKILLSSMSKVPEDIIQHHILPFLYSQRQMSNNSIQNTSQVNIIVEQIK